MSCNELSIIEGGTAESSTAEGMDRTLRNELFLSRSLSLTNYPSDVTFTSFSPGSVRSDKRCGGENIPIYRQKKEKTVHMQLNEHTLIKPLKV